MSRPCPEVFHPMPNIKNILFIYCYFSFYFCRYRYVAWSLWGTFINSYVRSKHLIHNTLTARFEQLGEQSASNSLLEAAVLVILIQNVWVKLMRFPPPLTYFDVCIAPSLNCAYSAPYYLVCVDAPLNQPTNQLIIEGTRVCIYKIWFKLLMISWEFVTKNR